MKYMNTGIVKLAVPLILSNLTVPLLGFTNIFIAGHLHNPCYVAAVGLGGTVFNLLFLAFAFLRMGTTGLVSQAYGQGGAQNTWQTIIHSVFLALCIGILIIMLKEPFKNMIFGFIQGDPQIIALTKQYFSLRILAAPAALINFVIVGALIGLQNMFLPLVIMMTVNGLAIVLGLELAYVHNLSVEGIALADVIAQYSGVVVGIAMIVWKLKDSIRNFDWKFNLKCFQLLSRANSDIFLRTLCLIGCYLFFSLQSLKLGPSYLAANTILMSFMTFTSYAQDGFANVAESLVGKNVGSGNFDASAQTVLDAGRWAITIAILFSIFYLLFGHKIINMMTNLPEVRYVANNLLSFIVVLPMISFACYFLDGVFIGANKFKEMRNTMFGSFIAYLTVWWCLQDYGNIGLWAAILSFFGFRGLLMGWVYWSHHRKKIFFAFS